MFRAIFHATDLRTLPRLGLDMAWHVHGNNSVALAFDKLMLQIAHARSLPHRILDRCGPSTRATLMLVLVTATWGLSLPLCKSWQDASETCPGGEALSSLTLLALRMALATGFLVLARPRSISTPTHREHRVGFLLGLAFFLGMALQVWGLAQTSPARSGFISSLCSAWVPLLALLIFRVATPQTTWISVALGLCGTAVFTLEDNSLGGLGAGELRTLFASVAFAIHIILLDRLAKGTRAANLTFGFLVGAGLPALVSAGGVAHAICGFEEGRVWLVSMLTNPTVLANVLLLSLLPTLLALHWMNVYQPRVTAGRAALIYLLEPVFGTLFSAVCGYESLSTRLLLGGTLILAGNTLLELRGLTSSWSLLRRPATT